jgi:aminoglycoside N3'-acetyltransferase
MSSNSPDKKGEAFANYWDQSGIESGDTILIHSSMRRAFRELGNRGMKLESLTIINSLLKILGEEGTLILPLFNFDFPSTKRFSMQETPSQMGKITEDARLTFPGVRTGHPIYSFFVIGFHRPLFEGLANRSGYGSDSPFAKLLELDAKIGVVDLEDQDSMTMYHHVEQMLDVPYRYHKDFSGTYEDTEGKTSDQTFSVFVRRLEEGVETNVNKMGEILWREGVYTGSRPGVGNGLRVAKAKEIFQKTKEEIEGGRALGTLYAVNKP